MFAGHTHKILTTAMLSNCSRSLYGTCSDQMAD
jgi:hypothetical protein